MMNNMNEMICIMNNEVEDYDACDASSTRLRLCKLKALMDSSCYVYHLIEEEMKTIKCIERFDISKMNRLCPDVEHHILGFIGNPCKTIKGYADMSTDIWRSKRAIPPKQIFSRNRIETPHTGMQPQRGSAAPQFLATP